MKQGLVVVVVAGMAACGARPSPEAPAAGSRVEVTVASAGLEDIPDVLEVGGVVRAAASATLSSRIVAPVERVLVKPGDRIHAGQVLVVLDARQLDAEARRATASAAAVRQALEAAAAEHSAATAALSLARATHGRIAALSATKSATAQELDDATAALSSADARLKASEARRLEAQHAVDAAEDATRAASVARSYASIAAPFDGVVVSKSVDPGALASPGQPLLLVDDDRAFTLQADVDERRAGGLAAGARVDVIVDALGPAAMAGRISEVARGFDPTSHTLSIKIALPHADGLRSGMFGRALMEGPRRKGLTVPGSALVQHGQLSFLFVADGDVARMRLVRARPCGKDRIVIDSGVTAGELVIVQPPPGLADGQPIARKRTAIRGSDSGGGR